MTFTWRKSTYSGTHSQSECVEVAPFSDTVGVRDSKNRDAGHLTITRTAWAAFINHVSH